MPKMILDNVTINAKSGGNIRNGDFIVTNCDLNFSEESFNFEVDEAVAIVEEMVSNGLGKEVGDVVRALQTAKPEKHEEILKGSVFSKTLGKVKDVASLIKLLLDIANNAS